MTISTTGFALTQKQSNFSILSPNTPLIKAYFQGKNDGLDQVYLKGDNGHNYVLEYDSSIEFYDNSKGSAKPIVKFMDGQKEVEATIEYADHETQHSLLEQGLNYLKPGLGNSAKKWINQGRGIESFDYNPEHSKIKDLKIKAVDTRIFEVTLTQK